MPKVRAKFNLSSAALMFGGAFLTAGLAPTAVAQERSAPTAARPIVVAAQPISSAIQQIARQTGQEVIFVSSEIPGGASPEIRGTYTTEEALRIALTGTSLRARRTPQGAYVIERRPDALGDPDPEAVADAAPDDIVVTGTLIRGVAPAGSNTIGISREQRQLSGAVDNNELLAQLVPQSNAFMDISEPGGSVGTASGIARIPLSQPNLRNLSGTNLSSGALTLVLLNGGRIVPVGVEQSSVDVGILPSAIIENTEIVFDGTSAVYGSDAVGGTINYITRKRFDGARLSASHSFADQYSNTSASATIGTTWATGGIGFSYEFNKISAPLDRDRPFTAIRNYLDGGQLTETVCNDYSSLTIGTGASQRRFLTTDLSPFGADDYCFSGLSSFAPDQERHSAVVVFSQELGSSVTFDVTGFYSQRTTSTIFGPFVQSRNVTSGNPYYRQVPGFFNQAQSVQTNLGGVFGNDASRADTKIRMVQISPSLTAKLGNDWQIKLMGSYGKSSTIVDQVNLDTPLLNVVGAGNAKTCPAGSPVNCVPTFDPYDPAATLDRSVFANLLWNDVREGKHEFSQARALADGPLFSLPGGEIRAAIGAEWSRTTFSRRITDVVTHARTPWASAEVSNAAVFGEVSIPVVGPDNSRPGIQSLMLSASGRYDHYAGIGGTFNPKVAVTYKPADWLAIRGNWGRSFRAPNAVDRLGSSANNIRCAGSNAPGCTNSAFAVRTFPNIPGLNALEPGVTNVAFLIDGTSDNLQPETSTNWAIGADLRPSFLPGLSLSATYWHIQYTNMISRAVPAVDQAYVGSPDTLFIRPTAALLDELAKRAPNGPALLQQVRDQGYFVLYARDISISNLASQEQAGIDASARLGVPTGFGSIDASVNASWQLKSKLRSTDLLPYVDTSAESSLFRAAISLGINAGRMRAQATVQHRSGFAVPASSTRDSMQTRIGSFQLTNLALRYDLSPRGSPDNSFALRFAINNIFNSTPPINRTTTGGPINGTTFGRVFQFGIDKEF